MAGTIDRREVMGEGFQFLDILLFALVAAFILLRLRNTLGKRTGNERPPIFGGPAPETDAQGNDNVVQLPDRRSDAAEAEPSDPALAAGLREIRKLDREFSLSGFVEGARNAYEMIVHSFAVGDLDTLRPLLSPEVFGNFATEIERREKAGETLENTLVAIATADAVEIKVEGRTAEVTVKFKSEMISVTRDAKGQVVDGDPRAVRKVVDIWTFARNLRSSDPNWNLIKTQSGEV
jgi:predicted lipid-binding transport protein (Tim44 family)